MNKQNLLLTLILSTIALSANAASSDSQAKDTKTVAWYTANVREARAQNKMCFDNPELNSTTNCKNSLHALQLLYVGVGN